MKKFIWIALAVVFLTSFNDRTEKSGLTPNPKSPEIARLGQFVGKWVTTGYTVGDSISKSAKIESIDIYEWAPGGCFVIHRAFGRIGSLPAVSMEIIGYDSVGKKYKSHFFGADGSTSVNDLIFDQGKWYWQSNVLRGNGIFSSDGRQLVAHHEKPIDKGKWVPAMEVILNKVE